LASKIVFLLFSIVIIVLQAMLQAFIMALLLPATDNTASLGWRLDYWQAHFIWAAVTTSDDLSITTATTSITLRHELHH
jgi:hypothetical protein